MEDLFKGAIATSNEVLTFRDKKIGIIEGLNRKYSGIITIQAIAPGPIKNSLAYKNLVNGAFKIITRDLGIRASRVEKLDLPGGFGIIIALNGMDALLLKEKMVEIEEKLPWGRILDIDVISGGKSLSRGDLNLKNRKCLICDLDAHLCARAANHSLNEILLKINNIYVKNFIKKNGNINIDYCKEIE